MRQKSNPIFKWLSNATILSSLGLVLSVIGNYYYINDTEVPVGRTFETPTDKPSQIKVVTTEAYPRYQYFPLFGKRGTVTEEVVYDGNEGRLCNIRTFNKIQDINHGGKLTTPPECYKLHDAELRDMRLAFELSAKESGGHVNPNKANITVRAFDREGKHTQHNLLDVVPHEHTPNYWRPHPYLPENFN